MNIKVSSNFYDYRVNFGVLIPFYSLGNEEDLYQSLISVANQTIPPNSIVISVNGENAKNYNLPEYFLKDKKIQDNISKNLVILKSDLPSIANALNIGIDYMKEDWIIRLDSDDKMMPNRIEKTIEYILKDKELKIKKYIYYSSAFLIRNNRRIGLKKAIPDFFLGFLLSIKNPIVHPSICFSRNFIIENNKYRILEKVEDYDLWCRVFKNYQKNKIYLKYSPFRSIKEPLIEYSVNFSNSKASFNIDSLNQRIKFMKSNLNFLPFKYFFFLNLLLYPVLWIHFKLRNLKRRYF